MTPPAPSKKNITESDLPLGEICFTWMYSGSQRISKLTSANCAPAVHILRETFMIWSLFWWQWFHVNLRISSVCVWTVKSYLFNMEKISIHLNSHTWGIDWPSSQRKHLTVLRTLTSDREEMTRIPGVSHKSHGEGHNFNTTTKKQHPPVLLQKVGFGYE